MGSKTDEVLARFTQQQGQAGGQTKEAAAQQDALSNFLAVQFMESMKAQGVGEDQLSKFAEADPQGYNTLVNEWMVGYQKKLAQEQQAQAMAKMAEAQQMEKVAEFTLFGKVAAHAFVQELGNIFATKIAEDEEEKKEEGKEEEKKEEEKKEEEKKEEEKKEGSVRPLPENVDIHFRSVQMKKQAGRKLSDEELNFLALVHLHQSGENVQW